MKLHVKVAYLKGFKGEKFEKLVQWRDDEKFVDIDAYALSPSQLDKLVALAKAALEKDDKALGARGLIAKIAAYRNIQSAPEGKKISKLENFAVALRAYIEPTPNKWVFYDETDGFSLPYYVQSIKYNPPTKDTRADVDMKLAAVTRNQSDGKVVSFHRQDLGKTVSEILNAAGFYLETPEAVKRYEEDIEIYKKFSPFTGRQYRCSGTGTIISAYHSYDEKAMERDGVSATVVMDDEVDENNSSSREKPTGALTPNAYWTKPHRDEDDDDDDEEEPEEDDNGQAPDTVVTPVHPYVKVFDLDPTSQGFVLVHVRNLTPYVYDKGAADKLVLPKETKDLITILVEGSSEVMEDIIAGKTGGTIVIATGPPGTGKTLTAEVFSEAIEKPLYVVQCSQLGTDEENVEKRLTTVLRRASRWKAILLIDEADVYVHTRGSDIQQNAIVGVFLRVLERYRGVLFLTSNREVIIDDAIMSRATAWIRYEFPTPDQLRQIWAVLSKQYRMDMSSKAIDTLIEAFPRLSGRNVKNLLKLAGMLARKKKKVIDVELFKYVSGFLDLRPEEKKSSPA